ncbi:hypothetical protein [Vreelandella sulfidaeris]|uniref:Uncharacterized protein n=1 Tax=Vreelandella sulfidaeris TaxID=115553 RepID=A0A455UAS0_9GAMM|nr:hypothetical protein HSBAA_29450 [Halomonas sulfidaeris]
MTEKDVKNAAERVAVLSDILLEHITNFDDKVSEVIALIEKRIDVLVEQRVIECLKERGHVESD